MQNPIPSISGTRLRGCVSLAALAACALASNAAHAEDAGASTVVTKGVQQTEAGQDEIVVYGRSERLIGIAAAASEGGVAGADISLRPLLRPAELLEATPGLLATQHSGGGKANQYFLRGFNLDHGTDFAAFIDDVPLNFRTHGHGQGYLDVNGLIPEAVARVDYRKGPYRADTGDFSFVGSSFITTHDEMRPFATGEVGGYGYRRLVAGGSAGIGEGSLMLIGQVKRNDGPWHLPEDFEGYSGLVKFSAPLGEGDLRVSANLYQATWAPTEQIPERAVGTVLRDRYDTTDFTLRGKTSRQIVSATWRSEDWRLTGWAQHYDWSLLSNFTFFLDDPVNGDQLRQYDRRWSYGGHADRIVPIGDALTLKLGGDVRRDAIDPIGLDKTTAGVTRKTTGSFTVTEDSAGLYGEATMRPSDALMIMAGLRADWYDFKTTAIAGESSWTGRKRDSVLSPKIGINYEIAPGVALYANFGEGFHSNDARGVTNPVNPAPGLVEGTFREIGARFERGGAILTAVAWWSDIDSELIYVGDSGAVEPSNPGRRRGYELTGFWKSGDWLAVDAVLTGSRARYLGLPAGQNHVPGALDSSGEVGVSALFPDWNASARLRHLGPHALVEDNSQRGEAMTLVNLRAAWTPRGGRDWEIMVELLNALASKGDDIDYYYVTRLPGEPAEGVEGRNSRVVEPRQIRVGITHRF